MSDTPRTDAERVWLMDGDMLGSMFVVPLKVAEELERELAAANAEREALQLKWQQLHGEIDCRIEHGAKSNGHLEAIRKMMQEVQP